MNSVFAFSNLLIHDEVVALVFFFLILKALLDSGSLQLLIINLKTFQKAQRKCKAADCFISVS